LVDSAGLSLGVALCTVCWNGRGAERCMDRSPILRVFRPVPRCLAVSCLTVSCLAVRDNL
jgi:hypothetical protein